MLTREDMARQLCRYWSRVTTWSGGLTYCEPDSSTPANLYACPLPPAAMRLSPAASIVLQPSAAAEPNEAVDTGVLVATFVAPSRIEAFMLAGSFEKAFWPAGRSTVLTEAGRRPMEIGVADDATEWYRFTEISRIQAPQLIESDGPNQTTEEGYAAVEMFLEVRAVAEGAD